MKKPNVAKMWLSVDKITLDEEEHFVIFIPEWLRRAYRPDRSFKQVECRFHAKKLPFKKRRTPKKVRDYFKANWSKKLIKEKIKNRKVREWIMKKM